VSCLAPLPLVTRKSAPIERCSHGAPSPPFTISWQCRITSFHDPFTFTYDPDSDSDPANLITPPTIYSPTPSLCLHSSMDNTHSLVSPQQPSFASMDTPPRPWIPYFVAYSLRFSIYPPASFLLPFSFLVFVLLSSYTSYTLHVLRLPTLDDRGL
jgi:hypothetical protein